MKRVVYSLLTAFVMLVIPVAQAENLSVDRAKDAAAHYMQHNTVFTRITPEQLTLARQWNNEELGVPSMYLFTAPKEGWIIMAATTVMDPIVAFADDNTIDVDNIAPQFEYLLSKHNEMICAVQKADAEKGFVDSENWIVLANHQLHGSKSDHVLLSTAWNQGTGNDYNIFCPVVNGSKSPTGCVATALAQICKYYEYPKKPQDRVSYWNARGNIRMSINFDTVPPLDYSLMPNFLSPNTAYNKKREVSRLGYYVGLAVQMQYGAELSGSDDGPAVNGMFKYFKYSYGTIVSRRSVNDTNFLNSTRRELMKNRPLYMGGSDTSSHADHSSGHAWVCDGYQDGNTTMYHMNWGWGRTGNGFYNLGINDIPIDGQPYNFNVGQSIIINMVPPQDSTSRQIGISEVENAVTLGRPYPNPATLEVVLPYSIREAADLQVYSVSGHLVISRRLQAGNDEITLNVDALPSGIYIYRVGDAHGKFIVR